MTLDDAYSVTGYNYIDMDTPKSDGTEPTFARPEESEFLVDCAGIRAAENVLIDEGETQVQAFETFKQNLVANEKWVFLVSAPDDLVPKDGGTKSKFDPHRGPLLPQVDIVAASASFPTPTPPRQRRSSTGEHALVRAIGDSIHSVGTFTAMLNNAAQLHAYADLNAMPRPTRCRSPDATRVSRTGQRVSLTGQGVRAAYPDRVGGSSRVPTGHRAPGPLSVAIP